MIKTLIFAASVLVSSFTEKDFIDCVNIYRFLNGKPEMVVVPTMEDKAPYRTDLYEDLEMYLENDTISIVKEDVQFLIRLK